ncbi:MAG TPA: ester cyclase [Streptosporangiaceae bacterium]|nr:ester cyclase [Streptosporangiaceae bacterium]
MPARGQQEAGARLHRPGVQPAQPVKRRPTSLPATVWHGNSLGDLAGAENLVGLLGSFIGALPDLYAAEQDITAENDLVMVRLVVTATAKGSLLGVPADGKPVRWNAVDIYRVTDGKISEEWAADDIATIMAQLSVFSPPWAA